MKNLLALSLIILTNIFFVFGKDADTSLQRKYSFGAFNNYDLRNSSTNFIGTYRILNDAFNAFAEKNLNTGAANIAKGFFAFGTNYLTMLWSHEMGHYIRAKQVGGKFNIHNFGLPVPYTTATLPNDITLSNEAIFVTAGFEVNYLNIRSLQSEFIRQNGMWNEDLSLAFANRIMYPIYTSLIVPIDPEKKDVWINTAGDPVHYILPVFKLYSGNEVFIHDSLVNPKLVKFYNQSAIFGSVLNFFDPQFYREIGASFGKKSKNRKPFFLIGNYQNGWTYGTLFNASPLGYELYFQNYLHLNGSQFGLYLKYGRPFKNLGTGLKINDLLNYKSLKADLLAEFWDQDIFGKGVSMEVQGCWKFNNVIGINFTAGYKSKGYVLGKQLSGGPNIGLGITLFR
ncbi:MAG: hypothetical protein H6605_00315 [Flavobacteriales bacterium]|nr:hypothetical protein [Flavobacteriales bacterium]